VWRSLTAPVCFAPGPFFPLNAAHGEFKGAATCCLSCGARFAFLRLRLSWRFVGYRPPTLRGDHLASRLTPPARHQASQFGLVFLSLDPAMEFWTGDDATNWPMSTEQCARDDLVSVREHVLRILLGFGLRRKCHGLSSKSPSRSPLSQNFNWNEPVIGYRATGHIEWWTPCASNYEPERASIAWAMKIPILKITIVPTSIAQFSVRLPMDFEVRAAAQSKAIWGKWTRLSWVVSFGHSYPTATCETPRVQVVPSKQVRTIAAEPPPFALGMTAMGTPLKNKLSTVLIVPLYWDPGSSSEPGSSALFYLASSLLTTRRW